LAGGWALASHKSSHRRPYLYSSSNSNFVTLHEHDISPPTMYLSPSTAAAGKGVLIGLASAFGSAALVGLILYVIYFFKYTSHGRILLDRFGRPGEFDDEQAFLREEAEALERMDDISRQEYLRAKGEALYIKCSEVLSLTFYNSICTIKPTRFNTNRHFIITVFSHSGEGRFGMGV